MVLLKFIKAKSKLILRIILFIILENRMFLGDLVNGFGMLSKLKDGSTKVEM
jgi:hypothetical protein